MKDFIVSASILGVKALNLDTELEKIRKAGIGWVHFDVMDGKFVKNVSFEDELMGTACEKVKLIKDVHIMIEDPLSHVEEYAKYGADYLTFHYEACKDDSEVKQVIDKIHSYKMKAGLSIKPNTPVEVIYPFLKYLDLVLIMSVEPGYGGQKFQDSALLKIAVLQAFIAASRYRTLISVDGGINDKTAPYCLKSGANVLVVGQYLFGKDDYQERYKKIKECLTL